MSSPSLPRPPHETSTGRRSSTTRTSSYTSITSSLSPPPSTRAAFPSSSSTSTSASASSISLYSPSSSSASGHYSYSPRSPPHHPHHQRYASCSPQTPRTPPRSSTTTPTPRPRASPLLHRLLQPFVSSSSISSGSSSISIASEPTSPTYLSFVQSPMALHQPTPRTPLPNSNSDISNSTMPTTSTTSSEPRPASRSERLLRDALQRDEMERRNTAAQQASSPPLPPAPSTSSSSAPPRADKPTHRRRHSHASSRLAATLHSTSTSTASPSAPRRSVDASPERRTRDRSERDELLTRGGFLFRTAVISGGPQAPEDPRSRSPTPSRGSASKSVVYGGDLEASPSARQAEKMQTQTQRRLSYAQTQLANARSTSHSPSPMRRARPSALPLSEDDGLRRHKTVHAPGSSAKSAAAAKAPAQASGEPLLMTPHEQALRARLERVLVMSAGQERADRDSRRVSNARRRSESRSASANEVRDEQGGRPWRSPRDVDVESTTSGPLYSAPSNNSGGSSAESVAHTPMVIPLPRTGMLGKTHTRNRSKTDPASPPAPSSFFSSNINNSSKLSGAPSPRRSSTAPSGYASRIPTRAGAGQSPALPRTGTTPPLVAADGDDADVEEGEENDAARLITPPPTPPFTARIFSFGASEAYFPSPYKTTTAAARDRAATVRGGSGAYSLGSPRRPRNAPIGTRQDADESSTCSSSPSQASFPASSEESSAYRHRRAQSVDSMHPTPADEDDGRPTFNARKASAHCRAVGGYVSFADVEGLGAPMDLDCLTADDEALMAAARARAEGERGRGVFGASWAGWRKLLGTVAAAGVGPAMAPAAATNSKASSVKAAKAPSVQSAQGEGAGVVL